MFHSERTEGTDVPFPGPENESPRYEHHRRFKPSQLAGSGADGESQMTGLHRLYFLHGEQGELREAYQFARYIRRGAPTVRRGLLGNVRGHRKYRINQGELDDLGREGVPPTAMTAGLSIVGGGRCCPSKQSGLGRTREASDGGGPHARKSSGPNGRRDASSRPGRSPGRRPHRAAR